MHGNDQGTMARGLAIPCAGRVWRGVLSRLPAWMLLAGLAVAMPTQAGELRKCALAHGGHAYVSSACPAGSRQLWRREVDAEAVDAAAIARQREELAQWQQARRQQGAQAWRRVGSRNAASMRATSTADASRCERARQRRGRIRDRDWMRMTYDRMIRLDDEVADACR